MPTKKLHVVRAGLIAVGVGALVALLLPILAGVGLHIWPSIQLFGYLLAAFAVWGVLGFVFAIPRARTEGSTGSTAAAKTTTAAKKTIVAGKTTAAAPAVEVATKFESNSNLEQVSDWLTKLLLGAALTQLALVPAFLKKVGDYLGSSLGFDGGQAAAVAIVLYGSATGFLILYLWTRLSFRLALEASEKDAEDAWNIKKVAEPLTAATGNLSAANRRLVNRVIASLKPTIEGTQIFHPVLWVDDHPANDEKMIQALRSTGIPVEKVSTVQAAEDVLAGGDFGLVITSPALHDSDGKVNNKAAEEILAFAARQTDAPPVIVYSSSDGVASSLDDLKGHGAAGILSSPLDLYRQVVTRLGDSTSNGNPTPGDF